MRAAHIDREVEPLLGFIPSLLLGAAATIGAVALGGALPLLPEHARTLLVPGSFATLVSGLLLLMGRSKAISQVCGYRKQHLPLRHAAHSSDTADCGGRHPA